MLLKMPVDLVSPHSTRWTNHCQSTETVQRMMRRKKTSNSKKLMCAGTVTKRNVALIVPAQVSVRSQYTLTPSRALWERQSTGIFTRAPLSEALAVSRQPAIPHRQSPVKKERRQRVTPLENVANFPLSRFLIQWRRRKIYSVA